SVVQALVTQHNMSLHVAWRVSFLIVPFALIVSTAIAILLFGDDCPQGKWENRHMHLKKNEKPSIVEISNIPEDVNTMAFIDRTAPNETSTDSLATLAVVTDDVSSGGGSAWSVVFSKETFLPGMLYLCSFGAEIAVEGMISGFFMKHSRLDGSNWTEAQAGGYASIFGLMNFVTRPLGGYIADLIYKHYSTVGKKWWVLSLVAMEGIAFIVIGCLPTLRVGGVVALMSVVALAMELGNGANYALVPHLNPSRNGLVSGMVGAFGNLGGIVFALVFRFSVTPFQGMWISGVVVLASVLSVCWVPVSKSK
ncbi:major facilitator superfamily domain-containing protein, partial [Globomyces pollinis-pini]